MLGDDVCLCKDSVTSSLFNIKYFQIKYILNQNAISKQQNLSQTKKILSVTYRSIYAQLSFMSTT